MLRREEPEPRWGYHGTHHLETVLKEGLKVYRFEGRCIWMALEPREAENYGDVVRIDLDMLSGSWPRVEDECDGVLGELSWQAHYSNDIPLEALRAI
jgi:hypothetical protein